MGPGPEKDNTCTPANPHLRPAPNRAPAGVSARQQQTVSGSGSGEIGNRPGQGQIDRKAWGKVRVFQPGLCAVGGDHRHARQVILGSTTREKSTSATWYPTVEPGSVGNEGGRHAALATQSRRQAGRGRWRHG